MKKKLKYLVPLCLALIAAVVLVVCACLGLFGKSLPRGEFALGCYELTIEEGSSIQIEVIPDLDGLSWESTNTSVATVEDGLVTAVSAGSADILVTGADDKAICRITVTEKKAMAPALSVAVDSVSLFIGRSFDLQPRLVLDGQKVECDFVYEVKDPKLVSVKNGVLTGLATGKTEVVVMATYQDRVYQNVVSVRVTDPDNCLILATDQIALCYGKTVSGDTNTMQTSLELDYTAYLKGVKLNKSEAEVSFISADTSVATVSNEGVVKASGIGRTVITLGYLGEVYEVYVTVGTPIASRNDLNALANAYLNATDKTTAPALWREDRIYVLADDIDFEGAPFLAIASLYRAQDGDGYWWRSGYQEMNAPKPYAFAGIIDGAGHRIKNMTLAPVWAQWDRKFYIGANFIGHLSGTVRNIIFEDMIVGENVSDPVQHIGLIGNACGGATLSQVYLKATVNAGSFASDSGLLIAQWPYDGGNGDTVTVENCIVEVKYAKGWKAVSTYGATSKKLCPFVAAPNSNRDANISGCYIISNAVTEADLQGSAKYIDEIYPSRETMEEDKTVAGLRNEGFEDTIIDCVIIPDGYTVKHMWGDVVLRTDFVKAEVGTKTKAKHIDMYGFVSAGSVSQKTVAEDNKTVVTVKYYRNMLIETFEQMPKEGNYTYQEIGYENSGKVLLLNGNDTGYRMDYNAFAIRVVSDSYRGNRAVEFQKHGFDRSSRIVISLTDEQIALLKENGSLSFWFKNNDNPSIKVNGVEIENSTSWKQVWLNEKQLAQSANSGTLEIDVGDTWNQASIWIDNIVVNATVGYTVEHKCGDTVLKSQYVQAKIGSTTAAKALEIPGFAFTGTIEQTTVASGNTTVVTVNYTRDELVNSIEDMPVYGNYTYGECGYMGKILLLDGVDTGYRINHQAYSIRVVEDAHSGDKAIRFEKDGYNTAALVVINLTEKQKEALQFGGSLSFWYKSNGGASVKVNGVDIGASSDWKQIQLDETMLSGSAETGTLEIELYDTWNQAAIWVDDIVAVAEDGYTVKHIYNDMLLKTEYIKADIGSTTAAAAAEIPGFTSTGTIEQTTVAADNSTVIVVNYARDMLVDTLEHMPLEGNYTLEAVGYDDYAGYMNKVLYLDGADTGYRFAQLANNISVVTDAHSGEKAIQFHKSGADRVSIIWITLTAEQTAELNKGGELSFWFKNNGGASVKVNNIDVDASESWKQVVMTEEMLAVSAEHGRIKITMTSEFNDARLWVDDIVVTTSQGYSVKHMYGDIELKSEFVKAEAGSTTAAAAAEIPGFTSAGTIEQTTVAEGNTTVVTVNYTRDMLMDTLEHMPLEGYTYQAIGYQNSGKVLLLNGEDTGYRVNYQAAAVDVVTDAHSGGKAIRFQKNGADQHITIEVSLTAEQIQTLQNNGDLSFWYKNNGLANVDVNGVNVGGSESWKQVVMTEEMLAASASSGKITIYLHSTWNEASIWIDDIVVTTVEGYTVDHKYGNVVLKSEFIKAAAGSTTTATAAEIPGFTSTGTIEQTTVAADNSTVIVVNYARDMLKDTLEHMPLEGNYTLEAVGYDDYAGYMNKVLYLDGADTGYRFAQLANNISVVTDAHSGEKAIQFHKSGVDRVSIIWITLTAEQTAELNKGGELSFWFKNNGNASIVVNGVDVGGSESWKQVVMTEEMLAVSAEHGRIKITMTSEFNDARLWVDDIVVTTSQGYTVEHKYGDTVLKSEFIKAAAGSTTAATAAEIDGFVAPAAIEQTTVAEGTSTVVTINYTRDMLKDTLEHMPLEGNYTLEAVGYDDYAGYMNKVLYLDGADTGYRFAQLANNISVVTDAHSGEKAIQFHKSGVDRVSIIWITLTAEQTTELNKGGELSFWFKNNGNASIVVNGVDVSGSESWKQVVMTEEMLAVSAEHGRIKITMTSEFNDARLWVDDIVVTVAQGYTVEHKYGDVVLKSEFIKATAGSTTTATAAEIDGFIAPAAIEQTTVAEGTSTVVTINYTRDMLKDTLEHMPLEGNYTFDSCGYMGKVLMLDGVDTGYRINNQAQNIAIVTDAHSGSKAIEFQKDGQNTTATIYITLTAEQIQALQADGDLSFWYKNNGGASVKVNNIAVDASESWKQVVMTEEMLTASASSGKITIELYNTWNAASIWVDDIVVTAAQGYTVEHKYGDVVLKSEFIKAAAGSTTTAAAVEIDGFIAPTTIEQTTVAEGTSTVVTINYTRDMLVDTLEHMPLEGNYTFDSCGYLGKVLMLDGVDTGYRINNQAQNIAIVTDAHSGNKAIQFQKDGQNTTATIYITLTAEQIQILQNNGDLSFWFKNNGGASVKVNNIDVDASESWKQVVMTEEMLAASASSGKITIELYNTWNAASIWVDDIAVTTAVGYTVKHMYGDTAMKTEFVKAAVGSTTAAADGNFLGFKVDGEIQQETVAKDNVTVIVVNYTRDMLVDTLEHMPLEGNYTFDSCGYLGKVLMLDGVDTGYRINNQAQNIAIVTDAHSGSKAIQFQKDGQNTTATIYITLTAEQIQALQADGDLSFWFKNNGGASVKVNNIDVDASESWKQVVMTEEMLAASASSGKITIELYNTWNAASIWVDDIVVAPAPGYTVKHMYGDVELKSEFVKAEAGSTTAAAAAEIPGFTSVGTIEQTTVAEGNTTVVTVNYTRDMLMDTLEHMPLEGNYTFDSCGYLGKVLMLDGVDTGYRINNQAQNIAIVTDAHSGSKAIEFQKDGQNTTATIYITLTAEQIQILQNNGDLSFWFKNNGGASVKVNNIDVDASESWKQVVMTEEMLTASASSGKITIELYNTWNAASIWVDDIVVTAVN